MSTALLGYQSVQERQGGVWEYVSPSRLACWIKCPLAFRLRYLDGIKTPTTSALFLGSRVHQGLEAYYRHLQLGVTLQPADVVRRLQESWAQAVDEADMKFGSTAEEQAIQKQAADLVTTYLAQTPKDERPLAVETAVEAMLVDPSTGENLGVPLVGIMDLVLEGQDGALVCDFKTTSRAGEPLEIVHEVQLTAYSLLYRSAQGRAESGLEIRSLIKTKVAKVEFHRYPARTEFHFRRFFSIIREYLDALDAGRFNYRPGFGCSMCDHRNSACRSWAG